MKKNLFFLFLVIIYIQVNAQNTSIADLKYSVYESKVEVKGTNVTLDGTWTYTYYCTNHNTNITGGQITNNTSDITSGTLKLMLFLTTSVYTGGTLSGWSLFEHNMGQLQPNQYLYNINWWSSFINYPANGNYYVTLALLEYESGAFYIINYLNYDDMTYYGCNPNGFGDFTFGDEISIRQNNYNSVLIEIPEMVSKDLNYVICDMSGKEIYKYKIIENSNNIDLSFLNSGLYISSIFNKNEVLKRQKILIVK